MEPRPHFWRYPGRSTGQAGFTRDERGSQVVEKEENTVILRIGATKNLSVRALWRERSFAELRMTTDETFRSLFCQQRPRARNRMVGSAVGFERSSGTRSIYLPIIRIENEPGTMGPRAGRPAGPGGAFAGAGPYSAVMVSM